jgi:penicillin-binding protein 1A
MDSALRGAHEQGLINLSGSILMNRGSPKTRTKRRGSGIRLFLLFMLGAVLLTANAAVLAYFWFSSDLPPLTSLRDYQPKVLTEVYDRNGKVFTRFFEERRTPRDLEDMPPALLKAIIAAEDADFYRHAGTDWLGLVRAAFKNLVSGKVRQGASTITEQTVKTFLLSPERTMSRRLKAMLLAWRLEKNLKKDEILALYLNQIYFGHGNYGVSEAARYYFGKDLISLNLAECAMIASLPQGPELLSPYRHFERLKKRQNYVLTEMRRNGFITHEEFEDAKKAPLKIIFHRGEETARDYYAEHIRLLLAERFGQDAVFGEGLKVEAAVDAGLQKAALESLTSGLREVDKRQGYRGPISRLGPEEAAEFAKLMREKTVQARSVAERRAAVLGCGNPFSGAKTVLRIGDPPSSPSKSSSLAAAVEAVPQKTGETSLGVVGRISDDGIYVFTGAAESFIPFDTFRWARRFSPARQTPAPKSPSEMFKTGDAVLLLAVEPRTVKIGAPGKRKDGKRPPAAVLTQEFELYQEPLVQGALIAIDTDSGGVLAMAGGADFSRSPFNRALQAKRQPGSAFKPIIYSLAIQSRRFTPLTLVNDSPYIYKDPQSGVEWRPENFESETYDGLIPLKEALARSKNLISARLVEDLGVDAVISHARRLGISSELPRFMSLSLGSGEVTPMELSKAYAAIAGGGRRMEPVYVRAVRSRHGAVLWKDDQTGEQALDPAAAFVTTDMMRGVIERGTGTRAQLPGRPAAGKTGTTNEGREAWFGGFVPRLLAMVYVGFDDHSTLGPREQGGRTATPIWAGFMSKALEKKPVEGFAAPPGVVYVKVQTATGAVAEAGEEDESGFQALVAGTGPAASEAVKSTGDLMREDMPAHER